MAVEGITGPYWTPFELMRGAVCTSFSSMPDYRISLRKLNPF